MTSEGSRYSELCAAEPLVMGKSAGLREVDWLSESENPDDPNIFLVNDGEDAPPPRRRLDLTKAGLWRQPRLTRRQPPRKHAKWGSWPTSLGDDWKTQT